MYKRIWRPQSLNTEGSGHPPAAAALPAFPDDILNLPATMPLDAGNRPARCREQDSLRGLVREKPCPAME